MGVCWDRFVQGQGRYVSGAYESVYEFGPEIATIPRLWPLFVASTRSRLLFRDFYLARQKGSCHGNDVSEVCRDRRA